MDKNNIKNDHVGYLVYQNEPKSHAIQGVYPLKLPTNLDRQKDNLKEY